MSTQQSPTPENLTEQSTTVTGKDNRTATDIAGERYRFETLTTGMVVDDMWYGRNDLGPGDTVHAFDLPTTDGGRFTSSDLGTRPVLMIFGSRTCPITRSGMRAIYSPCLPIRP